MNRQAYAIFCDDIRHELGGKLTLVGVYSGSLLVQAFPSVLPKLCLVLKVFTPIESPFQRLKIRILKDDETIAEGELPQQELTVLSSARVEDPEESNEAEKLFQVTAHFVFSPLKLDGPCVIGVRIETEDGEMKTNSLRIATLPGAAD